MAIFAESSVYSNHSVGSLYVQEMPRQPPFSARSTASSGETYRVEGRAFSTSEGRLSGHLPVLTPRAPEVASQASQGQPSTPWIKMEQGFDLDGRYSYGRYPTVNQRVKLPVHVLSRLAIAGISRSDFTAPSAYETLNPPIFQWPTKQSLLYALFVDHWKNILSATEFPEAQSCEAPRPEKRGALLKN